MTAISALPRRFAGIALRALRAVAGSPRLQVGIGSIGAAVFMTAGSIAVIANDLPRSVDVYLAAPSSFRPLPDIMADLKPNSARPRHARIGATLEITDAEAPWIAANEAKILDRIHDHLRTRTTTDLAGEAGAEGLRAAVRTIVDDAIAPHRIRSVLLSTLITD